MTRGRTPQTPESSTRHLKAPPGGDRGRPLRRNPAPEPCGEAAAGAHLLRRVTVTLLDSRPWR